MRQAPNVLEPLEFDPDRPPPKYAVFDIESNDWKDFVILGYYDGEEYSTHLDVLEFLLEITRDGVHKTVFAHNGGAFDFNFVLEEIVKKSGRKHFTLEGVLPRGSSFLSIKIKNRKTGAVLTFRDSLALLPFALKNLTDSFKTDAAKGEFDHSKKKNPYDPKLQEYLRDDCLGLYQVLEKYFAWSLIRGSGVSYTIASQALKVFRTTLKRKIKGCPRNVDEFVRRAYFGGRTEIFRPYFNDKSGVSVYDINSLYPSVMRDFEFPTNFKKFTHIYDPKAFGFYEATVRVPKGMYVPPLGLMLSIDEKTKKAEPAADSRSGKFIFPTGEFSGVWSTIELEYARSLGVKIVKTGRGAVFENGGYIFKPFVESLWEIRKNSAKDSVDSFIAKLLLNSCYGRFGLNLEREKLEYDDGLGLGTPSEYEFETNEELHGRKVIARFLRSKERISSFTNVAIAAWVTAHARIRMHKHYMKHQNNLYYTDTDSVFVSCEMESSPELGEFKYEYKAEEACFLLPKTYALSGIKGLKDKKGLETTHKAVIKGIAREAVKMRGVSVDDLLDMLEGDMKRLKPEIIPIKFHLKPRMSRVKTAMRKGTFLHVEGGREKVIKSRYDKRVIVIKNVKGKEVYDTEPIHIEKGIAVNYIGSSLNIRLEKKRGKKKSVSINVEGKNGESKSGKGVPYKRRSNGRGARDVLESDAPIVGFSRVD